MSTTSAQTATTYEDSPAGNAQRWTMEFAAARKSIEPWHERGKKTVARFRDEREASNTADLTRWNLFSANVQTQLAMLYGKTPSVTVTRRYNDAKDGVGRTAAELLERLLNADIQSDNDTFAQALGYALQDRLLPGLGSVRVHYRAEFEGTEATEAKTDPAGKEIAPAIPAGERVSSERVEVEYVHWQDQLWSPARTFTEIRWWAFRAQMSREELVERFGEKVGKVVPLNAKKAEGNTGSGDAQKQDPWGRADVWEVWDKERRRVFWFVEGYPVVLDDKEDPLGLDGFWPFPRPMVANLTTSTLVPVPDFTLAQDLYDEVDAVSTRITKLERAIKAVGVYDKTATEVARLLSETTDNQLLPVEKWDVFAGKGGLAAVIQMLPLADIIAALDKLRDYRSELIQALFQITGMSDIMRGQGDGVTATEQKLKAGFASVRMQALQDEFARFATDVQKLKAEIIAKQFRPETIVQRANAEFMYDAALAQQAVQLIQSKLSAYRVEVKPEAMALADFAQLKSEGLEVLLALTQFVTGIQPLAQAIPGSMPFLLQMAQWCLSRLKGASTMEGIFDQAITAFQQSRQQAAANPQPPRMDPKVQAQMLKQQGEMAKLQAETQQHAVKARIDVAAEAQKQEIQTNQNVKEEAMKMRIKAAHSPVAPPFNPAGAP